MLKVLAVLHGYVGGPAPLQAGAEHAAHGLLSALAARGHVVHVGVTPGPYAPRTGYLRHGVEVLPGDATHQALWSGDYDLVVTHLNATVTALHAADRTVGGCPTVVLLHNDHPETLRLCGQYLTFDRPRLVVGNSEWLSRRAHDHLAARHLTGEVGVVTANPLVPVDDYRTSRDRTGTVTLVNVNAAKGGVLLAEVAARMPHVQFLAVTGAYGTQETDRYLALPNVTVIPTQMDMRDVYRRTDVLMMGGNYESWGRVGIEAACSGIPTVSTPMPGPLEALGDAALFVDGSDVDGWVRAIDLLLTDQDEYDRRSTLSLDRARNLEARSRVQHDVFADVVKVMAAHAV